MTGLPHCGPRALWDGAIVVSKTCEYVGKFWCRSNLPMVRQAFWKDDDVLYM